MTLIACKSESRSSDTSESGNLLADLERRQNDVLQQLDELDHKLCAILKGLGVTPVESEATAAIEIWTDSEDNEGELAPPQRPRGFAAMSSITDETSAATGGFSKPPATQFSALPSTSAATGRQPVTRAA